MIGKLLKQRYQIVEKLGSGGVGETYIAEDLDIPISPKPLCVVKRLHPKSIDPDTTRLFQKEAEILYKLGEHCAYIPKLYAYFEENQEFYLVQELIEGHNLSLEIIPGKRWSEAETIAFLKEVLAILAYVHSHNVIHRDIKPSNLMRRSRDNRLILIDFGVVKEVGTLLTDSSKPITRTIGIGTFGYMPSEQAIGKPRLNSDIYAVGMVAIQALTGILPYQLPEDENGEIIWRDQAEVSDAFAGIINKMVRYHFSQRYQSVTEVLQDLSQDLSLISVLKPVKIGSKYGYKNESGQLIIEPQFDRAGKFSEGLAEVKVGAKYGYIDTNAQVVIDFKFDKAGSFCAGLARVKFGNKSTFIDKTGQILFDEASNFCEGLARVSIGSKYGYIDKTMQVVISPQFEKAGQFSEGLAPVKLDNLWGYTNREGKLVIEPRFDQVWSFSEGLALVKIEGKYGYIDQKGQLVTQLFDEAWKSSQGRATIEIKNKLLGILPLGKQYRTIDSRGKFIE